MRISIRSADGPNLTIPLPLSLAGSGFVWRLAAKYGGEEMAAYAPLARDMVRELRRYVRKHGHFCMVDIQDHNGDGVRITV